MVAILPQHRHHLADERWNCPADEFFRNTNLAGAGVIHYFADGTRVGGTRLGRNPGSWAGRKWYAGFGEAAGAIDLDRWRRLDPSFAPPLEQFIAAAPLHRIYHPVQTLGRVARRMRKRLARH